MEKAKIPSFITILILTLVTVATWVGFSIYRALTAAPGPTVAKEILNPLNPALDTSVINQVNSRIFLDDSQIPEINIKSPGGSAPPATPISTPVASQSATPVATQSAQPTVQP